MKLIRNFLLSFSAIVCLWPHPVSALNVSAVPSVLTLAPGQSYAQTFLYTLSNPTLDNLVESPNGVFQGRGGVILGTVNTFLSIDIVGSTGRLTETVPIPASIIERALETQSNPFTYSRTFFEDGEPTFTLQIPVRIASEAAADFSIRRLELYFPNRRGSTTVQQYTEEIKAYAEILFTGTGLLEGRWEVNGRTIKIVKQYLTFGSVKVLESPKAPILPTFNTGSNVVRFVIEKPTVVFNLPSIIYYVTPHEYPIQKRLGLIKPEPDAQLPSTSFELAWDRSKKALFYLVEFSEEGGVIFSAITPDPNYRVAQTLIDHYFSAGRSYQWRVKGFDGDGKEIVESGERTLRFAGEAP